MPAPLRRDQAGGENGELPHRKVDSGDLNVMLAGERVDADGYRAQMSVLEHLSELRRRILRGLAGVLVCAVGAYAILDQAFAFLALPLDASSTLTFTTVGSAFDLRLKMAAFFGFILASPWWLLQTWLFIAPALKRHEKAYALGFLLSGLTLFVGGCAMGAWTAPRAIRVLASFTPEEATNLFDTQAYIRFYLAVILAFGLSALVPLVLTAANFLGILPARRLVHHWRLALMVSFTLAAIANPLPGIASMCAQGAILFLLYGLAVGICFSREYKLTPKKAARMLVEWVRKVRKQALTKG